ncbi:putative chromosome segregation protein SudA [Linderina pennispora]|uniref:Putative chromosome segregation protein SudA n=1 Tax=Linderina pennispora TaxID=61395 RepID=A0A1Y1WH45_9FUNG|nr:putative chromosome segregation protein SudA [Linderina pennispora]ORX72658.1 putative chromosome segregation protein SudA [Linderina pennispora]
MHIKRITIQGFKSYKDETTTDPLSPHHNVVVGRNGSGKSNFFSAVRFVLSDAYTNLGREERQALLHEGAGQATMSAFVEIVFDNTDNRFPTGKDETVVRRTIGLKKDDYSLDRKSSTRAEIASLLESAGFSRSNPYYIVPQGRVTSLTHAKDSERLALLKEARRASSLKIVEETERTRLKIAGGPGLDAEKAQLDKYRTLDRDRRALEYAIYALEQEDVAEQLDEIDAPASARQEECSALELRIAETEPAIRAARQQLEILQIEREQLATEAEEHARTRAKLESAIQDLEMDRSAGRQGITELRRSADALTRDVRARETELARVETNYTRALQAETVLRQEFDSNDRQRRLLQQKQGRSGHFNSKAERDHWLDRETVQLSASIEQLHVQYASAEQEQADLRQRSEQAAAKSTAARERADQGTERISEIQARDVQLREQRDAKISQRKELWRKEARLESELHDLKDELRRAERNIAGTGLAALAELRDSLGLPGIHGPLFELFDVDETYRTCVESIAGASLFHVVVDDDETATRVLAELNRRKLGRLTFMAAEPPAPILGHYNRRFHKALQHVFGRTIICPSLDVGSGYARSLNLTAVTLEGDKVDRRGELSGGFVARKGSRLQAARSLMQIRTRVQTAQTQAEQTLAALAVLDQEITQLHSELQALSAQLNQVGSDRVAAKQELKLLAREEAELRAFGEGATKSLQTLRAQQLTCEAELSALREERAQPFSRGLDATERQQLAQLVAQVDAQAAELAKLSSERADLEGRRNVLQNELALGLHLRLEEARGQLAQAVAENPDQALGVRSRELAKLEELQQTVSERLAGAHRELAAKQREITDLEMRLTETRASLERETRRAQKEMEQLEQCLAQRNLYMQKKNEYMRNIQDLGVLPEEAFRSFSRAQLPRLTKKLHKTNEKLKLFGHVNKKAFEQYTIFARQRESIQERKRELDQSAQAIHELIEQLDQRKDEAIERTFKQVSKYFRDRSTDRADMPVPDDDDEPMSSGESVENYIGVSIRVSFNSTTDEGLRMQQLSGGQKSLVALALIFAIQRCDPAPFYLFDEIDANLDAVYRTAVADMIYELSRNCQFVTTTFRPEMLVHADKFYGVTFENKVSHITTIAQDAAVSFIEEAQPS